MGIFDKPEDNKNKKPDFSNVRSGSSSTAPSPGATGTVQVHVVKEGESLSRIAKKYYGDPNAWRRIFEANRDQIEDPDLIQPGQSLKIPTA